MCYNLLVFVKAVKTFKNLYKLVKRQAETAAMTFDKTIHDFGGVMEGDVVMTTFKLIKTTYYSFILNSPLWFDGLQL